MDLVILGLFIGIGGGWLLTPTTHGARDMENNMFPLFFRFREVVQGPTGWVAGVLCVGRSLLEKSSLDDEHDWWLSSVDLGGLSVGGRSPDAVREGFTAAFSELVFDLSDDCETYEAFATELQTMLDCVDVASHDLWVRALETSRENRTMSTDPAVSALPTVDSGSFKPTLIVQRLDVQQSDRSGVALTRGRFPNRLNEIGTVSPAA